MPPYSVAFLICWSALLVVWLWFGLPIGINTPHPVPRRAKRIKKDRIAVSGVTTRQSAPLFSKNEFPQKSRP